MCLVIIQVCNYGFIQVDKRPGDTNTELNKLWKSKKYQALDNKAATDLICKIKEITPDWVRIQRIQRDVPSQYINAGVEKSNLRQLVNDEMIKLGLECRCIRCREIGHKTLKEKININEDDIRDLRIKKTERIGYIEKFLKQ